MKPMDDLPELLDGSPTFLGEEQEISSRCSTPRFGLREKAGGEAKAPRTVSSESSSSVPSPASGRQGRWKRFLTRAGAAISRFSMPGLSDAYYKDGGTDAPAAFAGNIVHGRLKPLKLRLGVAKVAPGLRAPAGGIAPRHFHASLLPDGRPQAPVILDADPEDPRAVEQVIRELFEAQPGKFGLADDRGAQVLTNDDLALVHVMPVKGKDGRADTVHAVFRQVQKGAKEDGSPYYLQVYGASLSLTFKILDGRPVLAGYDGRLYPVRVDMTPRFSNDILQSVAAQRLMPATAMGRLLEKFRSRVLKPLKMASAFEGPPVFLNREIIPDEKGDWHAADIYQGTDLNGRPIHIAVDIATGYAFAWSAHGRFLRPKSRELPAAARPAWVRFIGRETPRRASSAVSVTVMGRGNRLLHGDDHGPIDAMPLPRLKVRDSQGRLLGVTDNNGRLALPGGAAVTVTAALEGENAVVHDADKKNRPLKITIALEPGEPARAVLNPTSDGDEMAGQINAYLGWTLLLRWMKSIGVDDKRVDEPLAIYNNKQDIPCNAYYDPLSDTLNLERETGDCENTAQPSILLHESGHRFAQFFARIDLQALAERTGLLGGAFEYLRQGLDFIMGPGVNEGTADAISTYYRGNPKIGEKFFKHPEAGMPLVIRDARALRPYLPGEAHDEGETLMEATWEIYEGIKNVLGEAAGAAYASAMVIPTLIFSQPKDVPAAMAQILLAAMHEDGRSPFAGIVRRAAQRREIPLPDFGSWPASASSNQIAAHPA